VGILGGIEKQGGAPKF